MQRALIITHKLCLCLATPHCAQSNLAQSRAGSEICFAFSYLRLPPNTLAQIPILLSMHTSAFFWCLNINTKLRAKRKTSPQITSSKMWPQQFFCWRKYRYKWRLQCYKHDYSSLLSLPTGNNSLIAWVDLVQEWLWGKKDFSFGGFGSCISQTLVYLTSSLQKQ